MVAGAHAGMQNPSSRKGISDPDRIWSLKLAPIWFSMLNKIKTFGSKSIWLLKIWLLYLFWLWHVIETVLFAIPGRINRAIIFSSYISQAM